MRTFVSTCIILIAVTVIVSCSKQDQEQSQLQNVGKYPTHPMAGAEIQFDGLSWETDEYFKNFFIYIHDRPDLFMPFWKMDVSLRLDTSSIWVPVNSSGEFVYQLGPGSLFIATTRLDTIIVSASVSVKIKFQ